MPQPQVSPRGKLEKKSAFSSCCGDKATIYYDRAFYFGPAIWDMLVPSPQHDGKYGLFLQCFRWRALWLRHFAGYPFGTPRIKHQPFPEARPSKEMPATHLSQISFLRKSWREKAVSSQATAMQPPHSMTAHKKKGFVSLRTLEIWWSWTELN